MSISEPKPPRPVHNDIAPDRAWQAGRRIYVRCGYNSTLGEQLRGLGANWDRDQKRLWIGTVKKEQVIPLILAADERARRIEEIKEQGRWLAIPYDASDIRERAKAEEIGAVYDGGRKQWAFPTDEGMNEIQGLLDERSRRVEEAQRQARQERKERQRQARAEEEAGAAREAAGRRDRIIAEAGRMPAGDDDAELRMISTAFMKKAEAWSTAQPLGAVLRLRDGRRGVVTDRDVWFTNSEMASSMCWHPETHDEAHWDFLYTLAIVVPTGEEQAADAAEQAVRDDAAEIHALMEAASHAGTPTAEWSAIEGSRIAGTIRSWYGTGEYNPGPSLILTADGRVFHQHPGWHDEFIHVERSTDDPELAARARAVFAAGSRQRHRTDQLTYSYEVVVSDRP